MPIPMTLTRKVGALLLLLTAGSLIGTVALALFFSSTTLDGLFLVAGNLRQTRLQQLYIYALMVRQGDDGVRGMLGPMIKETDQLIAAMEQGGSETRAGRNLSSIAIANRAKEILRQTGQNEAEADRQMIALFSANLPVPPGELQDDGIAVREIWLKNRLAPALHVIADAPARGPESEQSFSRLQLYRDQLLDAATRSRVLVTSRVVKQREKLVATLSAITGLSVFLLIAGLWFTRKYISLPIRKLEQASSRMKSGDFSHRIAVDSDDELASLARTFNEMSAEIHRQVERYKELFENAADGLFVSDLNWNILSVNKESERMTGYSRDELLRMKVDQLIPRKNLDFIRQKLEAKTTGGHVSTTYELPILTREGRQIITECSTRLVFEGGKPVAVQGVSRDITERKRLQEQLWIAQKMDAVGRLASGIAHDFGNVLTIITGYSALILATIKPDDPIRREVEGIQRSAQRATSMIRHLLSFSSGQVFRPRVINVQPTLMEMVDILRRLIGEDIRLETRFEAAVGSVRMDPGQLEQVVVNLALNARDAMPTGGALAIEAAAVDLGGAPHVKIRLRDTGSGIPQEILGRVFEPFFTTKQRGTGLGLSAVQAIIQQTGGTLSVESKQGEGTAFTLLIPRVSGDELSEAEEKVLMPRRGTETILLVEDELDVRALIRDMLRVYGYNVVEAEDQTNAIELCHRKDLKLDVLLTDVVMPNMSGPELVKAVQLLRPDLKVIYMSGHARDRFGKSGIDEDTVNFIQKPVMPEALTARIRDVLDTPTS
jgi:two-component system, cell cycle sensor histidine kinase and response regulator CckA